MVPAGSHRISRVPRYSGAASPQGRVFGYGTFTLYGASFQRLPLTVLDRFIGGPTTPVAAVTAPVWAFTRSLATTCAITFVFFSSGYLDVSVPRVRPALGAVMRSPASGCPIRKSAGQGIFAPDRGLSQLVTSFFASESPGILHVPFSPFLLFSPYSYKYFIG